MSAAEQNVVSEGEPKEVARYLEAWITGRPLAGIRSIAFVAERDAARAALRLLGPADVALVPAGSDTRRYPGRVIEYVGRFVEVGDELTVGELCVELRDYVAAAFVEILGPTAVVMNDESGWAAFLADADSALHEGNFVPQLRDPALLLAGRQSFLAPALPALFRPHFLPDGSIRNGPEGPTIGHLDEAAAELTAPPNFGLVSEYGGVVDPATITKAIASRPWLPRYIRSFELAARVHATSSTRISGFGFSVVVDGRGDVSPNAHQPFLYEEDGTCIVADLRTGRRTAVGPEGAVITDIALTSSSEDLALSRIAQALSVTHEVAVGLLGKVQQRLDVQIAGTSASAVGVQ
jgi:hypothetical protein